MRPLKQPHCVVEAGCDAVEHQHRVQNGLISRLQRLRDRRERFRRQIRGIARRAHLNLADKRYGFIFASDSVQRVRLEDLQAPRKVSGPQPSCRAPAARTLAIGLP